MPVTTAEKINMRRALAMLAAVAIILMSVLFAAPSARAEGDGMIRVRLTRLGAPGSVVICADCDYYLAADPSVRIPAGETVTVDARGSELVLSYGGADVNVGGTAKLMRSQAGNCGIRFLKPELSNCFSGDLGLSASGGVISAILNIYIENYLYGVVGYEMPPSSAKEALKAQAVAARTYALRKKATRGSSAYDVTDSTADQVFKGLSTAKEYAGVIEAVDETRGGVLYYGNSLAQCYFCASNGGQMESTRNAWSSVLPYSTVKDDPYDLENASATCRTATISKDLSDLKPELKQALAEGLRRQLEAKGYSADTASLHVDGIESVTACDSRFPAPSRLYKSLTFKLAVTLKASGGAVRTGTVSVSVPTYGAFESWYDLSINASDNETVWVAETDRAFKVTFRRYGHGIGLSQRGAQVMAGSYGKRMAEILQYYYPGTEGRQLSLADTTRDAHADSAPVERSCVARARLKGVTDLLSSPNEGAAVAATAAAGAVVDVYAVQGPWAAVGSGGKYGYLPTDSFSSVMLNGASVTRAEDGTIAAVGLEASVLQWPIQGASALGGVAAGEEVRVYAWTDAWAMIETAAGIQGFVPLDALSLAGEEAEVAEPEPEAAEAVADEVVAAPDNLYGQLRQDAVMYAANNSESEALGTLFQGSVVKLIAYDSTWAYVMTQDARRGYIDVKSVEALDIEQLRAGEQAAAQQEEAQPGGEVVRLGSAVDYVVAVQSASVYAGWSEDSGIIAVLGEGERVQVGAYNERWACVRRGDRTGYMKLEDLKVAEPAAPDAGGGAVSYGDVEAAAKSALQLHVAADGASDVLGEIPEGATVRVRAWNDRFAYVEYGDLKGFVNRDDLRQIG